MLPIPLVKQYLLDCIYILYMQVSSHRPGRWYYLNRFTLSTTSSPTFVGFFVCGMMGRLADGKS